MYEGNRNVHMYTPSCILPISLLRHSDPTLRTSGSTTGVPAEGLVVVALGAEVLVIAATGDLVAAALVVLV
jgi:hypothetical protein